ncbi:hypothetical protein BJF90_44020 [Pseudonocardia sp. CNS-004]|nr:hypothetical protein BJF90_44020 [Pseudonocardia sp. CNS-004]
MRADAVGARRLAGERDGVRVAAERGDVALHPGESGVLVEKPERSGPVQAREPEEPEDAEPVVDGDHHQRPGLGETARLDVGARACGEPTPVQPHQHRQPGVGGGAGRHGDVDREAVLGDAARGAVRGARRRGQLGAPGARFGGGPGAVPRLRLPRGLEAVLPDRGCRVRDPPVAQHRSVGGAQQLTLLDGDELAERRRVLGCAGTRARGEKDAGCAERHDGAAHPAHEVQAAVAD